ncbi:type VI secretion system membrane subunit TssM [Enterobacteriaceae bacterium 4M9]|nr:type VI secretion system membrane subunit TssM [Enterobacteriaceae bacterium 4M9]
MSFISRLFSGKSLRRLLLIVFFCLLTATIWFLGPYLGFGDTRPLESMEPRLVSLLMAVLLLLGGWFYVPMFVLVAVVACTLVWVVGPWLLTGEVYPLQSVFSRSVIIAVIVIATLVWAGWRLLQALAHNPAFLSAFVKKSLPEKVESASFSELRNVIRDGVRYMERMYRTQSLWRRFFFIRPQEEGLPWFLLLGPKRAGKTSLVFASGQDFPLPEQLNRKGKENAPTRHCECLFTNEALFLDTSGKYLSDDKRAHEEWENLVAALKKYRAHKAIHGVIVTLSAADILTLEGNAVLELSSAIRARLDNLRDSLGLRFPVYVTVTHLDQLTGFTAYFRHLTEKDREQIWGVTLPYGPQPELNTSGALKTRIEDELSLLESRILDAINVRQQEEYDVQERKQMYALSQDFRMLRHSIGEILHNIFFASRFDETCSYSVLRGIYFLSNCQPNNNALVNNSTLLQKWRNTVTQTRARTPASLSQNTTDEDELITGATWGRQFFHKALFSDVIVQDNYLASSDMRRGQHVKLWHLLGHMAAIAFSLWLISAMSASHKNNEKYLSAVTTKIRALATQVSDYSKQPEPENLPALLNATQGLAQYDGLDMESPAMAWRYGLYTGSAMVKNADSLYHFYLERYLVVQIGNDIHEALQQAVHREDIRSLYSLLKLYLIFSGSGRFDANYLAETIADLWEDNGKINAYGQRYIFVAHLNALFSNKQWHKYRDSEDKKLTRQARDILSQQTQTSRIWQRMQTELETDAPANRTLRSIIGDRSSQVFTLNDEALLQEGIPGIYTREAWQEIKKKWSSCCLNYKMRTNG